MPLPLPLPLALSAVLLTQPPAAPDAQPPAIPEPPSGVTETVITQTTVKPPPKVVPGAADDKVADSDALLAALETAGAKIRTLTADLTHINRKSELEAGQTITKRGRLLFQNEPPPTDSASGSSNATPPTPKSRLFQIEFASVEFGDERHAEDQVFIFDGQWLVEKQPANKQMFKYRVVPPGQTTDPLAVGEGPFPIPIGQKKDRILERFYATLLPPEDGFPVPLTDESGAPNPRLAWVRQTYQLRLIPKPTARESRDFLEIRLWYTRDQFLPRVARTLKPDESADEFLLTNLQTDQPLPPGAFDTAEKPGWNIQVQQFNPGNADK